MSSRSAYPSGGCGRQPVPRRHIERICVRVFGASARLLGAVELGGGAYNTVYRVELSGHEAPVVLRVAPEPGAQFRSERHLMRNEYATVPYLSRLASLMPRVLAADWSHEVIGRDWMVQSWLPGVPARERLGAYPRSLWPGFFRQVGRITGDVHAVQGPHFGPVSGPGFASWGDAVLSSLEDIAADVVGVGLDASDLRAVIAAVDKQQSLLDEVAVPRLLSGDLWTVNVMVHESAAEPVITGVFDMDRTLFGDPAADWPIRMAGAKEDERLAFWEGYGSRDTSADAGWRALVYEARHLAAIRLERHRLGNRDGVLDTYPAVAALMAALV